MNDSEETFSENDFEIEFTDLPLEADEMRSISGKLMTEGSYVWAKAHNISSTLALQGFNLMFMTRTWLLSEVPRNTFGDGSSKEDIELEIIDLPPTGKQSAVGTLVELSSRLVPRVRLWRFALTGCTILLAIVLFLGSFPSAREWTYNRLVHSTPTPGPGFSGSSPGLDSRGVIVIDSTDVPGAVWSTDATPGIAPQGAACPNRPPVGATHKLGTTPVWVIGFDSPYATLHLSTTPVPDPTSPSGFGWTTSMVLEVSANYTDSIVLHGGDWQDGTPLLFAFADAPEEQDVDITLYPQQPPIPADFEITNGIVHKLAWKITMYVPAAGCYSLNALWATGSWQINFAAGQ